MKNYSFYPSLCAAACLLALLLLPNFSFAEAGCEIGVTLIHGSKKAEPKFAKHKKLEGNAVRPDIVGFAPGLQHNLSSLPFSAYKRIQTKKQSVKIGSRASFSLRDYKGGIHEVSVTPTHRISEKIQALVSWKGPDNSTLLSTQLRIINGQNMVLGAEQDKNSSLIVNVSLNCLR
jgi:hypothetical protein